MLTGSEIKHTQHLPQTDDKWCLIQRKCNIPEASFEPEDDLCLSRRECACGSSTLDGAPAPDAGTPLGGGILWTPVAEAPSSSSRLS